MATVTGDVVYDFSGLADANPWTDPDFTYPTGAMQIRSGTVMAAAEWVDAVGIVTAHQPTTTTLLARGEVSSSPALYYRIGVGLLDSSGNGYIATTENNTAGINPVVGGAKQSSLVGGAATIAAGDSLELQYDTTNGNLTLLINGVSQFTATDTTYANNTLHLAVYSRSHVDGMVSIGADGYAVVDTAAPVLTNPSVTSAWKSATTSFDTDTGEGTASAIYYLATDPDPTAAEVDGNSYANTVAHVSAAVSAAGTVTLPDPVGLSPNTAYKVKVVHKDVAGNIGELVPLSFTTLSATMSVTIGNGANLTALEYRVQDGASLVGADIKSGSDASTDASGNLVINLDDVNVADGQQVYYVIADAADTHIAGGVATVSIG